MIIIYYGYYILNWIPNTILKLYRMQIFRWGCVRLKWDPRWPRAMDALKCVREAKVLLLQWKFELFSLSIIKIF